jgi:hypothetical protein
MNEALVELAHDDPLNAWEDIPVLELDGPLDGRVGAVLAALDQARRRAGRAVPGSHQRHRLTLPSPYA